MLEVGQTISGKYKLLRLLGDGGMGSVYEAEHLRLGTHVAIKVLHAELARRSGIAERFVQEARVSAQIKSAHVVQVMDVDHTPEGIAYLVMELLQGEPLSGVVRRDKKLSVGQATNYTVQILQALEAAHALGVIHRDLKPDNVFVTFTGGKPVLKLIDFGIAKLKTAQTGQTKNLTVAGMLMGTPEYMAPEQAYSADKVDVRADLYAVGVMLYEMLSGMPPVEAADPRVLIGKVERGEITPLVQAAPGIEPMLAGFVHRAMAPRPELRFANATEMRLALDDITSGKRQGTAKLAGAGVGYSPAQAAALGMADTAQPGAAALAAAGSTGTVMGAPAPAALSVTPNPEGVSMTSAGMGAVTPRGATQGVPAMQMPPYGGPGGPGYGPPPVQQPYPSAHPPAMHAPPPHYAPAQAAPAKKGGNGVIIALALVALLLGAGAVVTYVMSTQSTTKPPVAIDIPTATTPPTTPGTTPTTEPTITPTAPVTTLVPGPQPAPQPAPGPAPAAKDAGAPAAKDGGAPPPGPAPLPGPIQVQDAGGGQTSVVTPWGTVQVPGPRPLFWPPDQPWPPPTPGR